MIGIILALLASAALGLGAVLVRKRLDESNVLNATTILNLVGNIILWPLALLFTNLGTISLEGVLFFAIAGVLAPGIFRLLYYKGMETVGTSANASIYATYPMYSSIFAVLLLNEILTITNWIGIICIVLGVVLIERSLYKPKTENSRFLRKGLAISIATALVVAFAQIIRKYGLSIFNEPMLGNAIGYANGFLITLLFLIFSQAKRNLSALRKDFQLFWKAGVALSIGWILAFYALSNERVSIVTPILQTEVLFVHLFAYIYLKELEQISSKLVICALIIVLGITLVGIR